MQSMYGYHGWGDMPNIRVLTLFAQEGGGFCMGTTGNLSRDTQM